MHYICLNYHYEFPAGHFLVSCTLSHCEYTMQDPRQIQEYMHYKFITGSS